ncbi:hypothetical protein FHS43_001171 [Streptosporangium becharense]|uniref:Uncharacterized protein n=1 Tax=Streptosporangium becharense TaxID=1816182 RepID=A0A7W9IEA2_9ACTN|nr:hypothetical protein [Streptosporangium becharense]MBB2909925.1 hypothetical protein [Streptosporangium becharense]MBB5819120.1 hypothetical protein [Streptosporangium becharense]
MFADPPAPQPLQPGETPPSSATAGIPSPDTATAWEFNPDYQRLVMAWRQVLPELDRLTGSLDRAYHLAKSKDVWDAPVSGRYVEDMGEWRTRLSLYRQAILTSISDQAADTPRWVPTNAGAPHAFS